MADYTSFYLYLNQVVLNNNEKLYGTEERLVEFFDQLELREVEKIIAEFRNYSDDARWALYSDGRSWEKSKWLNHTAELCNFSKRYPGVMFILVGRAISTPFIVMVNNGRYVRSNAEIVFKELIPAMSNPASWRVG